MLLSLTTDSLTPPPAFYPGLDKDFQVMYISNDQVRLFPHHWTGEPPFPLTHGHQTVKPGSLGSYLLLLKPES